MNRSNLVTIMRVSLGAVLLFATEAFSAAQVNAPPIGIARMPDSTVRMLAGLPENIVLDSRTFGSFDAASFSDQAGLVAKNGKILLVKTDFTVVGQCETAEPEPVLNVDGDSTSAIAWLPGSQSILHWNGRSFSSEAVSGLSASLKVSSLRMRGSGAVQLLLTDPDGSVFEAEISLESGNLTSLKSLPGIRGPAFWQGALIVFYGANGLEAVGPTGVAHTIAIGARDLTFDRISSKWVLLTSPSAGRMWALHMNGEDIHLSEVPASAANMREVTK
ncbi:MAG TPA: hypothetical protein VFA65_22635 [Bryobacteraceae bacterium]|nr:hypothetical protein [Bryobacteraceae bacterium]